MRGCFTQRHPTRSPAAPSSSAQLPPTCWPPAGRPPAGHQPAGAGSAALRARPCPANLGPGMAGPALLLGGNTDGGESPLKSPLKSLLKANAPGVALPIRRNGHAYAVDGDVYFEVDSLPGYGALSGRSQVGTAPAVRPAARPSPSCLHFRCLRRAPAWPQEPSRQPCPGPGHVCVPSVAPGPAPAPTHAAACRTTTARVSAWLRTRASAAPLTLLFGSPPRRGSRRGTAPGAQGGRGGTLSAARWSEKCWGRWWTSTAAAGGQGSGVGQGGGGAAGRVCFRKLLRGQGPARRLRLVCSRRTRAGRPRAPAAARSAWFSVQLACWHVSSCPSPSCPVRRDLVFPHHENELAQSRAAAGACCCGSDHGRSDPDPPFVRYWLHNGAPCPAQHRGGPPVGQPVRRQHSPVSFFSPDMSQRGQSLAVVVDV